MQKVYLQTKDSFSKQNPASVNISGSSGYLTHTLVANPSDKNKKSPHKPLTPPPSRDGNSWVWLIYVFIFLVFILPSIYQSVFSDREITWQEFEQNMLARQAVEKIEVINKETAEVYIKKEFADDSLFKRVLQPYWGKVVNAGPHYSFNIGSVESFEQKLEQAQARLSQKHPIPVRYVHKKGWLWDILLWIVPILALYYLWSFIFRKTSYKLGPGGSSVFNFGKSTATLLEKGDKSNITFEEVAGLAEAKVEVKEIVDFLKDPSTYTRLGAKIPKGIIIVGPPGTGKTLLVKAVAGEAKVPFFSISGSEFVEMFVGIGASRVRDLFKRAKEKAPCIVFIDEIDAVGRSRGKNTLYTGANDERESTLNQLLTEMDGFGTNTGVIVLAATNRADMLDPALLRPGRFDRHIYLELPTLSERKEIFQVHMRHLVLDDTIDTDFLAAQTPGFSGADIANICNEAALIAARKKKENINKQDFLDAIERIITGLENKSRIISPQEKKIIAYHEAGHALVSWLLEHVDTPVKISIIPRGKTLGATWYLPEERQLKTSAAYSEKLCALLAGRVAEEIIFSDITSGALDDLEKVTREAYMMVAFYGFNTKIGNISFYDSSGQRDTVFQKPYSEETAKIIDEEVRNLVKTSYNQTKELLTAHKEVLIKIAELLLQKETIYKEDIETLVGKRFVEKNSATTKQITPHDISALV